MLKQLVCTLNFWLFIAFASGIALGNLFPYFIIFFLLSLIFGAGVYFLYKKNHLFFSDIFILFFFLSLGALWQISAVYPKIDKFLNQENTCVIKITSLPQVKALGSIEFADLKEINNMPFQQRVRVFDYTKSMEYLNTYRVSANLTKRQYSNNDFYSLRVKSSPGPKRLPLSLWDNWTKKITYFLLAVFKKNINDVGYRFLASVFLGRRELLSKVEAEIFKDAGISHLLAISGSNIALTAAVLFFILQLFNVSFRPRLLISLIFLFVYTVITGASPPILRAMVMYSVFASGYFLKRKIIAFNSLGIAGLVCLMINPSWLFDVGFQLSFFSIFALTTGFIVFPVKSSRLALLTHIKYLFFSSLFVSLFITPLVSYYFGRVYILTVFYNVILIPFFTLILMINFLLIVFSPLPSMAQYVGALLSLLIPLFYSLSQWLGSIKFSFIIFSFPQYLIYVYYIILLLVIFVFASRRISS